MKKKNILKPMVLSVLFAGAMLVASPARAQTYNTFTLLNNGNIPHSGTNTYLSLFHPVSDTTHVGVMVSYKASGTNTYTNNFAVFKQIGGTYETTASTNIAVISNGTNVTSVYADIPCDSAGAIQVVPPTNPNGASDITNLTIICSDKTPVFSPRTR